MNKQSAICRYFKILFFVFWVCIISIHLSFAQTKDLNFYIEYAKQNSPLLKDLQSQILANKLDSIRLRASIGPQVGANSTGTYAPVIRGYGYDDALSNGKTFNALVTVNKAILGRGNINNQFNSITLSTDSVTNTIRISRQDLQKSIVAQYITAFASQQQLDFNTEVYHLLKDEEGVLKKLTQNNVYKQAEYLTFFVSLQQQELLAKQSRITYINDIGTLNYLSGITDTAIIKLAPPVIDLKAYADLSNSVFAAKYTLDSLRLVNNRKQIDFNYKPKAGVYADAGYNSSFINQPYKNFGTSFGFTVSVPIYDGHQRKLQYNKINLAELTRLAYRDFFHKQHQQQIFQLSRQLKETEALNQQINEQIRFTKNLVEVNNKLLPTGDIRISDYIIAINNYLNAQNLLRQTSINRLQLINELNYWNQ
ncbi:MAG: hypothetical protein JWN56_2743 [Sphingobacteriales bacterium]|nr:hypothetical protein [Sphingobacteriales bacterium]